MKGSFYQKYTKRIIDLLMGIFLLVLTSPVLLITWIFVKIEEPENPAIFKQIRCGIHRQPFEMYKFRSMHSSAPKNKATRHFDDSHKYISKLGHFIRLTSIDELPQIFNILKGEMSFVGPRPVIYDELDLIEARDRAGAYNVLPGITGYAQINGRDEVEVERKAELDGYYYRKINLFEDIKLFLLTVPVVLLRKGHKDNEETTTTYH